MERIKQVKAKAVVKMETYLNSVYLKIGKGEEFSLDELARKHNLSGSIATVLKRCNVVKKADEKRRVCFWIWLYPTKPDKALALTMMDEVLRNNNPERRLSDALNQSDSVPSLFLQQHQLTESDVKNLLNDCLSIDVDLHLSEDDKVILSKRITFASKELINKFYKPNLKKDE